MSSKQAATAHRIRSCTAPHRCMTVGTAATMHSTMLHARCTAGRRWRPRAHGWAASLCTKNLRWLPVLPNSDVRDVREPPVGKHGQYTHHVSVRPRKQLTWQSHVQCTCMTVTRPRQLAGSLCVFNTLCTCKQPMPPHNVSAVARPCQAACMRSAKV